MNVLFKFLMLIKLHISFTLLVFGCISLFFKGVYFFGCRVTIGEGTLHIIMECLVLIPLEYKYVEIRALMIKLSKVGFKVIPPIYSNNKPF